ncbi:MAG: acetate--CoA ligase family protein [Uliginosibacterium sp.]|nr:acetate--CoA ligase family protein [Uliginosibacterium sp.]
MKASTVWYACSRRWPIATPTRSRNASSARAYSEKPILTCWLGDDLRRAARETFVSANIPTLRTPESAVDVFSHISAYYRNQQLLSQVPAPLGDERPPQVIAARHIIDQALQERRTTLMRHEALAVLAAFHIPVIEARVVHDSKETVETAMEMGFPVSIRPNAPLPESRAQFTGGRDNLASSVALHLACEELRAEIGRIMPAAPGGRPVH